MNNYLTDSTYSKKDSSAPRLVAVIDIGATSVRMQIAQINGDGSVERLESLSQAMSIGRDSFIKGFISRRTIEDCTLVLNSYRKKLEEYGVNDPRAIRAVATSGVREASNRLAFQDRIYVATGFEVEPLDPAELHRVTYLGVYPFFQTYPKLFEGHSAICEVGGGTTELLLLKGHDVVNSNSLRLGSLRLKKMLEVYDAPQETARALAESQIKKSLSTLQHDNDHVDTFISMGSEIRTVAAEVNPSSSVSELVEVTLDQLEEFVKRLYSMTANQIASEYHLPLSSAQTFGPALLTHMEIAKSVHAGKIMVSKVNLRDSLIQEMVSGRTWSDTIQKQIYRSAILLGQKFDFQQKHAEHVARTALTLFDQLNEQHHLDLEMRAILEVSSLLHEIGKFVNSQAFHKHSNYLISNSEFFGVGERTHKLIALVARYHRRALPQPSHDGYASLNRMDRIAVSQLAAILRIANAMDESHSQKIKSFNCAVVNERVTIYTEGVSDISMEQHAVSQAQSLFENIFGMRLGLQNGGA